MKPFRLAIGLALAGLFAAVSPAQQPAAGSGFKADLLGNLDFAANRLVQLAEAMPAEKYVWRPAAGVRSVSEVYMHVAGANYYIPTLIGAKMPEGFDREAEKKVTEKAQVVEALKKSIAHVRSVIESTPDAELEQKSKVFGRDMTKRAVFILINGHIHEHFGQSIGYARVNGVTPPWSAAE
jgi:uncharacterized damage-inducible protein DinB